MGILFLGQRESAIAGDLEAADDGDDLIRRRLMMVEYGIE